jgi:hypothetical protein
MAACQLAREIDGDTTDRAGCRIFDGLGRIS